MVSIYNIKNELKNEAYKLLKEKGGVFRIYESEEEYKDNEDVCGGDINVYVGDGVLHEVVLGGIRYDETTNSVFLSGWDWVTGDYDEFDTNYNNLSVDDWAVIVTILS